MDAAQNIIVKEDNCGALDFTEINRHEKIGGFGDSFEEKIYGKTLAQSIIKDNEIIIDAGTTIDKNILDRINEYQIEKVRIRSVLTCNTE